MIKQTKRLTSAVALAALGVALATACGDASEGDGRAPSAEESSPAQAVTPQPQSVSVETGVFDTPYGEESLTYVQYPDGTRVFDGDILLPSERPAYRSAGESNFGKLWSSAVVRYEATSDQRIAAAIAHWQERLPISFVVATSGNRIFFDTSATKCQSYAGMQGGRQVVNVAFHCTTSSVIHEIGHAIGLFHEHSRSDRDNYITVFPECMVPDPEVQAQFVKLASSEFNLGPYDLESIMHYDSWQGLDFGVPGCTATMRGKPYNQTIAPKYDLSRKDISGVQALYQIWGMRRPVADYDGDGKADLGLYRPSDGTWRLRNSNGAAPITTQWGKKGDVPVAGDYDGDGRTDLTVWRPKEGNWYVKRGSNTGTYVQQWGLLGDLVVPGNYDGDNRQDFAVWRPSEGVWYVIRSSDGGTSTTAWGLAGDVPVPGDYDGDGRTDMAVWRPSNGTWYVMRSSNGTSYEFAHGLPGDVPAPGDYDGDGKIDLAVWRPANGVWYFFASGTFTYSERQFGQRGDLPAASDQDGDRKADLVVWRPSNGTWYVILSSTNAAEQVQWGQLGDTPAP